MNPATLSIIAATFPPPRARDRDRHLGGGLGTRTRDRTPCRRAHHRAPRLELDLLRQRPGGDPRDRGELPLHRRVAGRDPCASRSTRARDIRHRPLRSDVRPDRGEHVRVELDADRGLVRPRRCLVARVPSARAPPARPDAAARALPKQDVHGREPRRAARRAGDVRGLLLRLAVPPEHPRLLRSPDRRCLSAVDDPHHPRGADRGEDERPHRLAGS